MLEHPLITKTRILLRPISRARSGKRITFFFTDKGIKGVPGDNKKDIIARYLQRNGVDAINNGTEIVIRDSKGKCGKIEMNQALITLTERFNDGKLPELVTTR